MTSLTASGSPPRQMTTIFSLRCRSSSGRPRSSSGTRSTPQTVHCAWLAAYSASHKGQYFISIFHLWALDGHSDGVASAQAQGGNAALQVSALQFVQQCDQDTSATGADGVADRHRAAVNVNLFGIEPELAGDSDRGYREGFIQLDEVDIF